MFRKILASLTLVLSFSLIFISPLNTDASTKIKVVKKPAIVIIPKKKTAKVAPRKTLIECKDGTFSQSIGRGTCSHHKGIK